MKWSRLVLAVFLMGPIVTVLAGCLPAIIIYPIRSVTYELNRDNQKWTQQDCTTNTKSDPEEMIETVCYKKSISEPPPGVAGGK